MASNAWEIRKRSCMDRISDLPDEILSQILSLIPIEEAVGTCILSRRWKSAWTYRPAIHVPANLFSTCSDLHHNAIEARFLNFVESVFNHVVALEKLELNCLFDFTPLNMNMVVWLPCLKVLHLKTTTGMDLSFVQNIVKGCPVLEELFLVRRSSMHNSTLLNKERLCVKSSSLKRLKLSLSCYIEIDANNLEHLDLCVNLQDSMAIANTSSLPLLTTLTLGVSICWSQNTDLNVHGNSFVKLLGQVPNISFLFLSSDAVVCLQSGGFYHQLPTFKNLMDLNMDVCSNTWPLVHWFLQSSPNLVSFSMRHDNTRFCEPQFPPYSSMVTSRLRHLEKVEFKKFLGWDHEMKLVGYLLENVPVLKNMTFFLASRTKGVISRLHNKLVKLREASTASKVIIDFNDSQGKALFS